MEKKKQVLWIAATFTEGIITDSIDTIQDIIGVYTSKKRAWVISTKVNNREPIKGLDYNNLNEFTNVGVFSRNLNDTITNEDKQ